MRVNRQEIPCPGCKRDLATHSARKEFAAERQMFQGHQIPDGGVVLKISRDYKCDDCGTEITIPQDILYVPADWFLSKKK